ncbi:MAG: DUF1015 domain-containing protein [Phycisphaeraceae bacterium]|nr:DUF1015 domain-containing protein [Phycisphaeraceae bacterium]
MAVVSPFRAIQFSGGRGDVSALVAPPYDVIDAAGKKRLLDRNPGNIVAIDLPHVPAKELGPPSAYQGAADRLDALLREGVLSKHASPAMFAYRQTFEFMGKSFERCGMACTVEIAPFGPRPGGGILPHEQTFSGPKEDRMALMKATRAQLSPIFGLYADDDGAGTSVVRGIMASRPADMTASTADGVRHEVWTVEDGAAIASFTRAMEGEDVFIADGHHRYTTALNYLKGLEEQGGVGPEHPARQCMIVLVGMSDPGLAIGPTHRVLGGMAGYSAEAFMRAASGHLRFLPVKGDVHALDRVLTDAPRHETHLGLHDFATGQSWLMSPVTPDPLRTQFPEKPEAWRMLDVAIIQHLIVEQICQPKLNGGQPVKWAFPHTIEEVQEIGRGAETGAGGGSGFAQMAVIVRPTPLDAVRDVSRANELMPQKSTFFYPKLATGLFVHRVE